MVFQDLGVDFIFFPFNSKNNTAKLNFLILKKEEKVDLLRKKKGI